MHARPTPTHVLGKDIQPFCAHPTEGWWSRGWHMLLYGSLSFGLANAALSADGRSNPRLLIIMMLTGALAAWYWAWIGRAALRSPRDRAIYFAVAGLLWTALLGLEPAYEVVSFSAFIQVTGYLSWRAGAPALVVLVAILQLHPLGKSLGTDDLVAGMITLTVALMAILPMRAIHAESDRRQQLIEELEQTRLDLALVERHAGILEERERVAGAIHDTVAQGLSSIVMLLEAAQASLGSASPGALSHIEQALQAARDNLREVRRLVWALRPESLEQGTLADAIRRLAESGGGDEPVDVQVIVDGNVRRLPTDIEVTLLRAAQELLSNIRKHAAAAHAMVALTYQDHDVVLEASDDGRGISPAALARGPRHDGGLGLMMMRERVEALRGSLRILDEHPGTTVSIRLPLGATPAGEAHDVPQVPAQ